MDTFFKRTHLRFILPRLLEGLRAVHEDVSLANADAPVIHEANFENSAVVLVQIDEYLGNFLRTLKDYQIARDKNILDQFLVRNSVYNFSTS